MWAAQLRQAGWPERAQTQLPLALAKSTRLCYNRMINKLNVFCVKSGTAFPPESSAVVAEFLCDVADSSTRPKAQLSTATAAMSCIYEVMNMPNVTHDPQVKRLLNALVKSQSAQPRVHTKVMPIEPFRTLFHSWSSDHEISIANLRLKAITLLALSFMLRPSDVAPKGELYDAQSGLFAKMEFRCDQLAFEEDNSLTIWFHGIKNDAKRDGFQVNVPSSSDTVMNPVATLATYIQRTEYSRPASRPVFVSLRRPYGAISSGTVGKILEESISLAGLAGQGFSAKSFRPTGASTAIQAGCNPDNVRSVGRWKCREVFEDHYVYPKVSPEFTNSILNA